MPKTEPWRQCDCGKSIPRPNDNRGTYLCPYCETPHVVRRGDREDRAIADAIIWMAVGMIAVGVVLWGVM